MPLSHDDLISLIGELGYPVEKGGMCFGLAAMGMQAILAEDLETFNQRIEYLEYIKKYLDSVRPLTFAQCIASTEKNRTEIIQECKDIFKSRLGILDDNAFDLFLKENKNHEDVKAYYAELKNINAIPEFSALIDARAFLEGIVLYSSPQEFPEIFEEKLRPRQQDIDLTFFRALPFKLIQKTEQKDDKSGKTYFIEKGQVEKTGSFSGAYTLDNLTHYFRAMSEQKACQPPVTLLLGSSDHYITVCYDASKKSWILIDANKLPAQEIKTAKEMATEVLSSFSSNNVAVFSTTAYSVASQASKAQEWLGHLTGALSEIHKENKSRKLRDSSNTSWLYVAACSGDFATCTDLLENHKINPNVATTYGATPLRIAAQNGYLTVVKKLIECKSDPNASDYESGGTPLHVAAEKGRLEVVKALLDHKGNLHAKAVGGSTPFYMATQEGHLEVAEELLKRKADPSVARTIDGATPAYIAAELGHDSIMNLLIKHRASLNKPIEMRVSALLPAAEIEYQKSHVEALFQKKGVDMDAVLQGFTAFHAAVFFGHINIVDILIKARVDIHAQTEEKISPLELGLAMGYADIAGKLLCRELDKIKVVNGSEKQFAVEKLRNLLTVHRDHKLTEVIQKEFTCFMQLDQYVEKLLSDHSDNQELLSLCSAAYANYAKAKNIAERSEAFIQLKESIDQSVSNKLSL